MALSAASRVQNKRVQRPGKELLDGERLVDEELATLYE